MYRTIRSLHLCAGAFSLVFLAMYALSALQMTHARWLPVEARITTREIALPPGIADARIAARELAARHGIEGELAGVRPLPTGLAFRILRPGAVWEADYASLTGATHLRLTDTGTLGALNRIHQMHGAWHTWIAYNLWASLLALIGAMILTLGATGVYLWWQSHRDRRFTGAVLIFAIAVIGGLALWMRW
jgi:hypothetical protein